MTDRPDLPHNISAEISLLGGILLDGDMLDEVATVVQAEDFYKQAHRHIWAAVVDLRRANSGIDIVTVTELLVRRNLIEQVGGVSYVGGLAAQVPTAANVAYYAAIVRDKATFRAAIANASEIIHKAYVAEDVDAYLAEAERSILSVGDRTFQARSWSTIASSVQDVWDDMLVQSQTEETAGWSTGLTTVDRLVKLRPGEVMIVAARPAMGKSALVGQIAIDIAKQGGTVAFFSLEMTHKQLARRQLANLAKVDSKDIRDGRVDSRCLQRLVREKRVLEKLPIVVVDDKRVTIASIEAISRRLHRKRRGLGAIILDYIQLVSATDPRMPREQQVADISRSLKVMAGELDCPVIALAQLNRGPETRTGVHKRPLMSDLRECVVGDTLVMLTDGRRVPIAELEGQTPEVWAVDQQGRLVAAASDKVWKVGTRQVFEVRLASGRSIRATARHRLLAFDGWSTVGQLREGARIAIARHLPEPVTPMQWPDAHVALLGQMIGDGSYLKGQPMRYTTGCEENSRIVTEAATCAFGAKVKRYKGRSKWHQLLISGNGNRWHPAGVNAWLRGLGVFNQRSHQKRIPRAAFRLAGSQIALLLGHLWSTDGCISLARSASGSVFYSTTSPGLAADVAALLLRLGIVGRTSQSDNGPHKPTFSVHVSGKENQQRFLSVVPAIGACRQRARKLADILTTTVANTNVDTVPSEVFSLVKRHMSEQGVSQRQMASMRGTSYGGTSHFRFSPSRAVLESYADLLNSDELKQIARSDLFWDSILSIEPAGEEVVYDLTVPGPASWLADGIVSHNSGAIEQDADIITFLYRDEYYNLESEDKGLAEIIIAKHREGDTGTVKTKFWPQYTRFDDLVTWDNGGPL